MGMRSLLEFMLGVRSEMNERIGDTMSEFEIGLLDWILIRADER